MLAGLVPSFLIGSLFLQVMRTCIKACVSQKFGQITQLTTKLAALEHPKIQCLHFFSVAIDPNLFKLAGIKDMHFVLDE